LIRQPEIYTKIKNLADIRIKGIYETTEKYD